MWFCIKKHWQHFGFNKRTILAMPTTVGNFTVLSLVGVVWSSAVVLTGVRAHRLVPVRKIIWNSRSENQTHSQAREKKEEEKWWVMRECSVFNFHLFVHANHNSNTTVSQVQADLGVWNQTKPQRFSRLCAGTSAFMSWHWHRWWSLEWVTNCTYSFPSNSDTSLPALQGFGE